MGFIRNYLAGKTISRRFLFLMAGISITLLVWELLVRLGIILIASFGSHMSLSEASYAQFLPLSAFIALGRLLGKSSFWLSIAASLLRILSGLLIAAVIAVPYGLVLGIYRGLRSLMNFPIQFMRMISPISWMPLVLFFLPRFEDAMLFLIVMASLWPILINTMQGVLQLDSNWINMAKNQGATLFQLILKVILPGCIPSILSGLRLALGIAWVVLVPAEMLGTSRGLGYLINDARDTLAYDTLMSLILVIGLIGYALDSLFRVVKRLLDWQAKA